MLQSEIKNESLFKAKCENPANFSVKKNSFCSKNKDMIC